MGLFKADLYRFFAVGFAAGALLVFTTFDGGMPGNLASSVVPAAEAASAQ